MTDGSCVDRSVTYCAEIRWRSCSAPRWDDLGNMISTLVEILDPQFLSRNSVYISLLVGLVAPMVGVYLVMRRVVFLGVALPQVSSCGIAFAFALQGWGLIPHAHDSAQERAI